MMSNLGPTRKLDGSGREFEVDTFLWAVAQSFYETAKNENWNLASARVAHSRCQTLGGILGSEFKRVSNHLKNDKSCFVPLLSRPI